MQINRETFEAWLFTQPDEEKYSFGSIDNCLMCRFLKDITGHKTQSGGMYTRVYNKKEPFDHDILQWPDFVCNLMLSQHTTFGEVKSVYKYQNSTFEDISSNGMTSRAHAESVTIKQNENTTSIITAG